jgi:hypothetical protein
MPLQQLSIAEHRRWFSDSLSLPTSKTDHTKILSIERLLYKSHLVFKLTSIYSFALLNP